MATLAIVLMVMDVAVAGTLSASQKNPPKVGKKVVDWVVDCTTAAIVVPAAVKTVAVVALNGIGFTSIGPAAGSYAAAWMSSLATAGGGGGVAAGSLYAALQSVAMTTPLVTPAAAVVGTGAAVYHLGPKVYGLLRSKIYRG